MLKKRITCEVEEALLGTQDGVVLPGSLGEAPCLGGIRGGGPCQAWGSSYQVGDHHTGLGEVACLEEAPFLGGVACPLEQPFVEVLHPYPLVAFLPYPLVGLQV